MQTARLTLRSWRKADAAPFLAMSSDPRVMAYFPSLLRAHEAQETVRRQQALERDGGHCFWIAERRSDRAFLGICGIKVGHDDTPIEGRPEVGWRFNHAFWSKGYAREAAEASLAWVWRNTDQPTVFAITVPANARSRALMARIGMARVEDGDFDHPAVARGHPLRRHVLYRIERPGG